MSNPCEGICVACANHQNVDYDNVCGALYCGVFKELVKYFVGHCGRFEKIKRNK